MRRGDLGARQLKMQWKENGIKEQIDVNKREVSVFRVTLQLRLGLACWNRRLVPCIDWQSSIVLLIFTQQFMPPPYPTKDSQSQNSWTPFRGCCTNPNLLLDTAYLSNGEEIQTQTQNSNQVTLRTAKKRQEDSFTRIWSSPSTSTLQNGSIIIQRPASSSAKWTKLKKASFGCCSTPLFSPCPV